MSGQLSVRARITAWNVGVVALVLILAGLAVRYVLQASLMGRMEKDLRGFGDMTARAYARLPRPRPNGARPAAPKPPPKQDADNPFLKGGLDLRPRVLDETAQDYRPERTIGPWDTRTFPRSLQGEKVFSTITWEGERLRVYSIPAVEDGRIQGVIQMVAQLSPTYGALDQLTSTLLVLFPAGLLLAALGGAFLTGRALRPVREITEAAGDIQAERLSARLPVRGKDEFARLTLVLNGMLERLEAAFERQKRFTGDASHELRTPLATIKATSSLAREDEWDAPACHSALLNIEQAADRAERIVDGLLLLARADSHTLANRRVEPASLDGAIHAAAEAARQSGAPEASRAPIRINLPPGDRLFVAVDADPLTRVFVNLLENALRHTPPEGEIVIRARPTGEAIVVSVRDTGEGIAPEHLPHLTERFYRADPSRTRARGGAGLGLAICRSILEAHGGGLKIASEPGRGTEVTVTLPGYSSEGGRG